MNKKTRLYLVRNRRKIRTLKAAIGAAAFLYLKFVLLLDVDAIFILLGWWWLQEIK